MDKFITIVKMMIDVYKRQEDGKISLSGSWRYSNEVNDETTIFNYKGTKID